MISTRIYSLIFLFIIQSNIVKGQEVFISNNLSEMYGLLPLECKNQLNINPSTVICNITGSKIPLKIKYDREGQVSHLGMSIFDFEDNLVYPSIILGLIERLSLEFYLLQDPQQLTKRNEERKIKTRLNGTLLTKFDKHHLQAIKNIFEENNFETEIVNFENHFLVKITNNTQNLEFFLPANYQLISGLDKEEFAKQIHYQLTHLNKIDYKWELITPSELARLSNGLFVNSRGEYFKNISANVYYSCGNLCEPVLDSSYPLESIQNSFLMPITSDRVKLTIEQRMYGNKKVNYSTTLKEFVSFFQKDHTLYFGFENNDKDNIEATLIISNDHLNYINLLQIKLTTKEFFSNELIFIESKLYTTIPSDNIKNLFADFK
jgi:hypothetical protein